MARVLTNNTGLRVGTETTIGVVDSSTLWTVVEFDTIGAFGAIITTVVRRPISQDRGRKKGTVVDLESSVEYETDLTVDAFKLFGEGLMFAEYTNVEFDLKVGTGASELPPPAVTAGGVFTIESASVLLAGKMQFVAGGPITLVYAKGYLNAINNGLHALAADVGSTDTSVDVTTALVDETPPINATLEVCGVRTDDVTLTITGSTATLVSAADVDWTTLGLTVGQEIHIGSADNDGVIQNAYDSDAVFGYARITAITTLTLTLDKLDPNIGSAGPHSPSTNDIMFGRFLRNVQVTADNDDERYLERTYQFEGSYPDLGGVGVDEYEYAIGNFLNEMTFNLPLTEKATLGMNFIGTNADNITPTRKTNAVDAADPLRTTAFNTATDVISITTDVVTLVSDVCFKSLTLTILNNVSPEKCLGTLGATFVNAGLFEANLEGQMLFTNKSIINAIKNNTTVTFQAIINNDDGAISVDFPELTLGGGGREFPLDQSVLVNITGASFTSSIFGYDIGISLFANVPGVVADLS